MSGIPKIDLRLGDCLEIMRDMPSASVDAVITSPPYNMRTRIRNGQYTERERNEIGFSRKYDGFHDAFPIDEYYRIHYETIREVLRVASIAFVNIQIVTGSKEAWFHLIGDYARNLKDVIVWDKGGGQPAMHDSVMNRGYELILIFESGETSGRAFTRKFFERGTMDDVWKIGRGERVNVDGHNAVMPLNVASKILHGWTVEGDTILDPFMGSGTTGVACARLNRNFIGIEINPQYFEIAQRRINEELGNAARGRGETSHKRLSESTVQESIF